MRAVAVNLAAVFPDIPAQLLALLGRQTAMLPTPPTLPITPALDVRISPQFALLPKIAGVIRCWGQGAAHGNRRHAVS